jgi:hypothetical protein
VIELNDITDTPLLSHRLSLCAPPTQSNIAHPTRCWHDRHDGRGWASPLRPVSDGFFTGERPRDEAFLGGGDWVINRPDGAMLATRENMARFNRGGSLGVGECRLRTVIWFETGDEHYGLRNDLTIIGISGPTTADRQYALHEIV